MPLCPGVSVPQHHNVSLWRWVSQGCQVRRETAHSESVCCYNVRALFDELPTPHLELEITVFPAGPLTALEYQKAQKLEGLLRRGNTI